MVVPLGWWKRLSAGDKAWMKQLLLIPFMIPGTLGGN